MFRTSSVSVMDETTGVAVPLLCWWSVKCSVSADLFIRSKFVTISLLANDKDQSGVCGVWDPVMPFCQSPWFQSASSDWSLLSQVRARTGTRATETTVTKAMATVDKVTMTTLLVTMDTVLDTIIVSNVCSWWIHSLALWLNCFCWKIRDKRQTEMVPVEIQLPTVLSGCLISAILTVILKVTNTEQLCTMLLNFVTEACLWKQTFVLTELLVF